MSDSGNKAGVDSHSLGYRLGSWWRRHPVGRWIAVGAVVLLIGAAMISPSTPSKSDDTIAIPASASDLKGQNYQDVATKLKTAGFASIETTSIDDLVVGWLKKDGDVERVSVDGTTDFEANSRFSKGAKIVITYHTFPEKESDEAAESGPAVSSSEPAQPSTPPVPEKPKPQPKNDLAKRTEKAYLAAFGVDSINKLSGLEGVDDSLIPFIVGFEDVGAGGTVKVTVQTNNVSEGELKDTARAIHSLVGEKVEDLDRVEVWTADGEQYGVSNRWEVPMLNQ